MHAVLGLVEHAAALALEHLVGDLELRQAELLVDVLADGGVTVMEARQAVHEDAVVGRLRHELGVDLILGKKPDALLPQLVGLAHRDPDVGVDDVRAAGTFVDVLGQRDGRAGGLGDLAALGDELGGRHLLGRPAGAEVHTELRAHDHEGVAHVVAGVAHEGELLAVEVAAELLLHGQHVGDHLRRVELGREAIPHGHASVRGEGLDDRLGVSAVLDAVVHAAEHARGVLDGLLLAHLRALGVEVGDAHAEVHGADLEGAAGARRGLLEEQDDVLSLEVAVRLARALLCLEVGREIDEVLDLLGGEVEELEEVAARDIYSHGVSFVIGAREVR